jgi:hypothetical protein
MFSRSRTATRLTVRRGRDDEIVILAGAMILATGTAGFAAGLY